MENTMQIGRVHRIAANLYGITALSATDRPRAFVVMMDATSERDACAMLGSKYSGTFEVAVFERAVFKTQKIEILPFETLPFPAIF